LMMATMPLVLGTKARNAVTGVAAPW
jgi:hypothetical protein